MKLVATGNYVRNTVAITTGLNSIAPGEPDAVIMVGAYKPCAEFIKQAKAHSNFSDAVFCNISFVGTKALKEELGEYSDGCIVSQVVPYPWDQSLPMIKEYADIMKKAGKSEEIGFVSLEGFMAAKLFCNVMEKINGEPTREKFLTTLAKIGTFDLGGIQLTYGNNDNQGMDKIFIVEFKGNNIQLAKAK